MKTEYFIELFERSHQYIDCDCARCKNSRQMAIGIIGTLFRDSKSVSIIKKKEDYSKQELIELFLQHVGTGLPILTRKKSSILTFGCQLSDRQTDGFVGRTCPESRYICWQNLSRVTIYLTLPTTVMCVASCVAYSSATWTHLSV